MVDPNAAPELLQSIEALYFGYRAFTSRPDHILRRRGLGRVHHRILYFIGRNPAITIQSLLAILDVSKQALNAPLRQLLAMGLVSVAVAPHDRRMKQLTLSAEGRQLESQLTATQATHLAAAFTAAGPEAAKGWREVMRTIVEVHGRASGRPSAASPSAG